MSAPDEPMSDADREFAREHARRWAYACPSLWQRADDYATWYLATFASDADTTMSDLPDHSAARAFPAWVASLDSEAVR